MCTRAGVADIRQILSEMAAVVSDMVDRVLVDLTGDELGTCLQVFNVPSWNNANQIKQLELHVAKLAKILNLNGRSFSKDFCYLAKVLTKVMRAFAANKMQVCNRQAWSWILCPEWRARCLAPHSVKALPDLEKAICFYLALKVNTTTLERNLGQLCQQLSSHTGPTSQDGRLLAAVLHVALDGPRSAKDVFEVAKSPSDAGEVVYTPTAFSVACGKLWLANYGRRFRYKYSKLCESSSSGKKRKQTPPHGSFGSVKKLRGEAVDRLCEAAETSVRQGSTMETFVPDLQLPLPHSDPSATKQAMSGTRWQSDASSSVAASSQTRRKKTASQLFRENTQRKRASDFDVSRLEQFLLVAHSLSIKNKV